MAAVESWDNIPTFLDITQEFFVYLQNCYYEVFVKTRPPIKMDSWNITKFDIACVVFSTAVLSTLRYILNKHVFMPLCKHYDIPKAKRKKVPESAWRFTFMLCIWCCEWYVVALSDNRRFLQKPEKMWHGWSLDTFPPGDIYSIYVIQCAFYFQWSYTTLFIDTWRKDSCILLFHHAMALVLIILSFLTRCHNTGVLTFFMDDITDISLEFAKLCEYFEIQGRRVTKVFRTMKGFAFACFIGLWFTFRLYWYPLKVMYSALVHPRKLEITIPYNLLMISLMWIHLFLNFYWTMWILKTLHSKVSGHKLKDPRE